MNIPRIKLNKPTIVLLVAASMGLLAALAARSYLSSLEGGMRVRRTDPKTGEFVYLQDSERSAELERARQTVETSCK